MNELSQLKDSLEQALRPAALHRHRPQARTWQYKFSPSLSYGRHFACPLPGHKPAAVLIIIERGRLASSPEELTIPLCLRPQHLPDHPGQVSLPGGRLERDESAQQAALREFEEETGSTCCANAIVGKLSPIYVFNSGYLVTPFVAIRDAPRVPYAPCQHEVQRLIHLPVSVLLDTNSHAERDFSRGQVSWSARCIDIEGIAVWGATAIILGELIDCWPQN
ncbi:MAG: CoA pyrophosphatase [Planctomycetales bacterium]|nr:CoA pyrophosphatase [Planctomycetales bacterium]